MPIDKEPAYFLPLKIAREKRKICTCEGAALILDTENRLVVCEKCGAILEPFEALLRLSGEFERIDRLREKLQQAALNWKVEAEKQQARAFRIRGVADISKKYNAGMWPCCPKCKEVIDPAKITQYVNRLFCEEETT